MTQRFESGDVKSRRAERRKARVKVPKKVPTLVLEGMVERVRQRKGFKAAKVWNKGRGSPSGDCAICGALLLSDLLGKKYFTGVGPRGRRVRAHDYCVRLWRKVGEDYARGKK